MRKSLISSSTPRRRESSKSSRKAAAINRRGPRDQRLDDLLEAAEVRGGRAGRQQFAQPRVEHRQPDLVLAAADHLGQRRGEVLDVFEFRALGLPAPAAEQHRAAGVDGQGAEQIGLFLVDADEGLAGAAEDFPIQPPQVLAAGILAEIDEFARPALLPRLVAAAVGAFDAMPRGEAHVLQRRQRAEIEKPAVQLRAHAAPSFSNPSKRRATMSVEATPSPTARWLTITRWRRMGSAVARRSSTLGA